MLVTLGAGDVDRLARALAGAGMSGSSGVPEGVERNYPLARLTTIRTGGPAEHFARVDTQDRLERLLKWAQEAGLDVGVVGSGSNLLVADQGVRGLVVKLDGELARIEHEARGLTCGGGARLPAGSGPRGGRWASPGANPG